MDTDDQPQQDTTQAPEPTRRGWMRRLAREGAPGRRTIDALIGVAMLSTVLVSAAGGVRAFAAGDPRPAARAGGLEAFRPLAPSPASLGVTPIAAPQIPYNLAGLDTTPVMIAAQSSAVAGPTLPATNVTFGCDVPATHQCGYTLFRTDGSRQAFALRGATRVSVRAVPDYDRYVVAVDAVAPVALDQCAAIQAQGHFCKAAVVRRGYNN